MTNRESHRRLQLCLLLAAVSLTTVLGGRGIAATAHNPARLPAGPATAVGGPNGIGTAAAGPPNIVFVLTDDLDEKLGTLDSTPNIAHLLRDAGTTLADFYVTYPLCCPSRTTILRGQYLHSHEVYTNLPPVGGYQKWLSLGLEASTVGTWLQEAGYRTVYAGKYLNGYPAKGDPRHVPAGWTEWYSPVDSTAYQSYDYRMNENGTLVRYGSAPEDYITDVIAGKAEAAIRRAAADPRPFFLHIATFAPHAPANPAPRHDGLFPDARVPRVPSFNELDVSDKPARIQSLPRLRPRAIATLDADYRKRLQSMQAVDEMVARLIDDLAAIGELDNTYFVFSSDNGYHMGHHRLPAGKTTAYEEDIRVPLIVRGPRVPAGRTVRGYLAGNVDLAATFADMAGVATPGYVEGRSLLPLLRPDLPAGADWRQSFLVEGYAGGTRGGTPTSAPTILADGRASAPEAGTVVAGRASPPAGVFEPPDDFDLAETAPWVGPAQDEVDETEVYVALRTHPYTYVEWKQTGERELYDNVADPYQLDNLAGRAPAALLGALSARANAMHVCTGAACREIEERPLILPAVTPGTPTATATPASPPAPGTPTATPHAPSPTGTRTQERAAVYLPLAVQQAPHDNRRGP